MLPFLFVISTSVEKSKGQTLMQDKRYLDFARDDTTDP